MSEKVLITGYNGALAKRVAIILEKKFHLVFGNFFRIITYEQL